MIRRDRNHPSVIIWSIGNEEDLQGSDTGARIAKSMKRLVRQFDSTRPVTEAMNDDWGKGLSAVVDVQGFNYHSAEQMDIAMFEHRGGVRFLRLLAPSKSTKRR